MTVDVLILTTVKDGAGTLSRCIESVIMQTHPSWKMLIIDDGSIDSSPQIGRQWAAADPRIKLVINHDHSRAKALNLGLSLCSVPYVAILDCDDEYHPEKLQIQLDILERNREISVLGSLAEIVQGGDRPTFKNNCQKEPCLSSVDLPRLAWGNCIIHSSVIMRLSALRSVGGYDIHRTKQFDYDLWIRFGEQKHLMAIAHLTLVAKRIHCNQQFTARQGWRYTASSMRLQAKAVSLSNVHYFTYLFIVLRGVGALFPWRIKQFLRRRIKILDWRKISESK